MQLPILLPVEIYKVTVCGCLGSNVQMVSAWWKMDAWTVNWNISHRSYVYIHV